MNSAQRLLIIGDGEFGEIAYEYFTHDSPYEVVAFAVEAAYRDKERLFDCPVIDFEDITDYYPPAENSAFVAITNTQLNRVRRRLYDATKDLGYAMATYVSSHAFVWRNVEIGDNSFIFENNVLQYHVKVGSNTVLWSGNHVGHRTTIGDHVFVTSHVVISGYCTIGDSCFLGVNSTLGDHVSIPPDCIIGMGSSVVKDLVDPGIVYIGSPARPMGKTAYDAFDVPLHLR
jgi:sugar O-acyltransferase (sialic acid O-acetyltransferase NeuD family)